MRKMMCLSRCCYAKINKVMPESKNLQRLTKSEKPRNARLCNNDKNTLYLPRQDYGKPYISRHNGAKWGIIW